MVRTWYRVWHDDYGAINLTVDLVFLFTILILGIVSGLVSLRQALITELVETANALMMLNQSYDTSNPLTAKPLGFDPKVIEDNCVFVGNSSARDDTKTLPTFSVVVATSKSIDQAPCD